MVLWVLFLGILCFWLLLLLAQQVLVVEHVRCNAVNPSERHSFVRRHDQTGCTVHLLARWLRTLLLSCLLEALNLGHEFIYFFLALLNHFLKLTYVLPLSLWAFTFCLSAKTVQFWSLKTIL